MAVQENPGRRQSSRAPVPQNTEARSKALALAKEGPTQLLSAYEAEFAKIAPRHVDAPAFVALAAAYVRRDEYLMRALVEDPASLVLALRECAALGHVPRKGEFALTAFYNKKVGGYSVVGIEEWRGVVQRMFRSGGVRAVHVSVGREHDKVLQFKKGRDILPVHDYDEFASKAERGPLKAVWAWADLMHGGPSEVAFLNRHDVERLRGMSKTATYVREGQTEATGGNFWGPAWPAEGPNTESMWRKTALHQLEGLVPISAGYMWEVAASGAAAATTSTPGAYVPDVDPGRQGTDWIDAEEVPAGDQARAGDWPATATPGGGA
jgi:recombination protein RecT